MARGMEHLPGPGITAVYPASAGRFLTTGLPGKSKVSSKGAISFAAFSSFSFPLYFYVAARSQRRQCFLECFPKGLYLWLTPHES